MRATETTPQLMTERKLAIATAPSRWTAKWKNREISWQQLAKKLSEPTRTPETFKEYKAMSKAQKGKVKDVGGFVAGTLAGGRRLAQAVNWRSMVTLDIDNAKGDVWSSVELALDGVTCLAYSTHSHEPKSPRLRLIIPLARNVKVDEYEPIARRIAADIGINMMDKTTYQPERLMFWASCSSDGVFEFHQQDGAFIDPDEQLARYKDWTDSYEWHMADDEQARMRGLAKKQGDPLEKKGFVGAFNRAYRIEDVIEKWLPHLYEPFKADRYTYTEGSTVGGLILYQEGTFAYSHHGTSPSSGQLTNAFDFLRLHLFGEQDMDVDPATPINRMPSYLALVELLGDDTETKGELMDLDDLPFDILDDDGDEQSADVSGIAREFDIIEDGEGSLKDLNALDSEFDVIGTKLDKKAAKKFLAQLSRSTQGVIESTAANVKLILGNDPNLAGKIAFDEFNKRMIVQGALPWTHLGVDWSDTDDGSLCTYLEQFYGIVGEKKITNALNEVAINNRFHPVRDYLEALEWDGQERIKDMLPEYFGAESSDYVRWVSEIHMAAGVARIYQEGIKYDTALVLIGGQGLGKSLFINKLAKGWGNDSLQQVDNKDAYESLQGSWLIELPEMSAMRRTDNETIKHFLSKQEDKFRPSYGRRTVTYRRQCTFWGTSNDGLFLKDTTGNRRFFPVQCGLQPNTKKSWVHLSDEEIDLLWAEAVHLYNTGFSIYLTPEQEEIANNIRDSFTEQSPLQPMIVDYLEMPLPLDWAQRTPQERAYYFAQQHDGGDEPDAVPADWLLRDRVCVQEVWRECLGRELTAMKRVDSRELNDIILGTAGWVKGTKVQRFGVYGAQRGYRRVLK